MISMVGRPYLSAEMSGQREGYDRGIDCGVRRLRLDIVEEQPGIFEVKTRSRVSICPRRLYTYLSRQRRLSQQNHGCSERRSSSCAIRATASVSHNLPAAPIIRCKLTTSGLGRSRARRNTRLRHHALVKKEVCAGQR